VPSLRGAAVVLVAPLDAAGAPGVAAAGARAEMGAAAGGIVAFAGGVVEAPAAGFAVAGGGSEQAANCAAVSGERPSTSTSLHWQASVAPRARSLQS
jgi:hypothetical protein